MINTRRYKYAHFTDTHIHTRCTAQIVMAQVRRDAIGNKRVDNAAPYTTPIEVRSLSARTHTITDKEARVILCVGASHAPCRE